MKLISDRSGKGVGMKPKSIADAALMLLAKKKEEKEQDGPFSWEREKY